MVGGKIQWMGRGKLLLIIGKNNFEQVSGGWDKPAQKLGRGKTYWGGPIYSI